MKYQEIIHLIRANIRSSGTIALLSLPFSVSLAVASQTTPIAGIITTIWAGMFGSLLGGSHYNIIGVTGALSGLLASYALAHGPSSLSMLAIITGLFIALGYYIHIERYLIFIPATVIHGFTLGIASIIALSQCSAALGLQELPVHQNLIENVIEALKHITALSWPAFITFLAFYIPLMLLTSWRTRVPWVILLTPLGVLVGYASTNNLVPFLPTLGTKFGVIEPHLFLPSTFVYNLSLLNMGFIIAFIAILETMLAARIADGMTKTRHNKRKELRGLAIANIVSGCVGGIPATAAIGRTILNIRNGATHKISGIMASIFLAITSFFLLPFLTYLPLAVIAAILTHTATRLVEWHHFNTMYRLDKISFYLALLVAFLTVLQDPTIALLIGIACSLLLFSYKLSHGHHEVRIIPHTAEQNILHYTIKGHLTYINSQAHCEYFKTVAANISHIHLDLSKIYFIDIDGVEMLQEIIETLEAKQIAVTIIAVNTIIAPLLLKNNFITRHVITY